MIGFGRALEMEMLYLFLEISHPFNVVICAVLVFIFHFNSKIKFDVWRRMNEDE